jgi:hypothetical protein
VPWIIIEDDDPRWKYDGFKIKKDQWNASGASLSFGYKDCKAEINFYGKAVQYYAYRNSKGGKVTILIDGKNYGEFSLKSDSNKYGQYYVKIFEKLNLNPGKHNLKIIGDSSLKEKTIDMLSIIPFE